MIRKLKRMWRGVAEQSAPAEKHDLALAVAALMVEVMRMDGHLHDAERSTMMSALKERFGLSDVEVSALIEKADGKVQEALDMHQFTSVVVKGFTTAQRTEVLAELWRVALADGEVDPYEEQLIRRVAELIGLHHRQFIEAKISAGAC